MSAFPTRLKWRFDPRHIAHIIPALSTERGRIIWGAIRSGHITDQNFNDRVAALADRLAGHLPDTAEELYRAACGCGLIHFGTKLDEAVPYRVYGYAPVVMDPAFWDPLLEVLKGTRELQQEYPKEEVIC